MSQTAVSARNVLNYPARRTVLSVPATDGDHMHVNYFGPLDRYCTCPTCSERAKEIHHPPARAAPTPRLDRATHVFCRRGCWCWCRCWFWCRWRCWHRGGGSGGGGGGSSGGGGNLFRVRGKSVHALLTVGQAVRRDVTGPRVPKRGLRFGRSFAGGG